MANSLIKTISLLALAIIITTVGGIGNTSMAPKVSQRDISVSPTPNLQPIVEDVVKSAPKQELPVTHYLSISPLVLVPKNESVTYNKVAGSLRETAGTFYAPVHLPQGATISALQAYVYEQDSTPATFIEVYLYRRLHADTNSEIMTSTNSQMVEESYGFEMVGNTIFPTPASRVVDNESYSYFVRTTFDTANPSPGMRLGPIVITYTMP